MEYYSLREQTYSFENRPDLFQTSDADGESGQVSCVFDVLCLSVPAEL